MLYQTSLADSRGTARRNVRKTIPIIIISRNVNEAEYYARDRGWARHKWKYISNHSKLVDHGYHTAVLAGKWQIRRDIDRILEALHKLRIEIVDDSETVFIAKRQLALLSVAYSALNSITTQCSTGPAINVPVCKAKDYIAHAIKHWSWGSNLANDIVNTRWITKKVASWENKLINLELGWSILILLNVALQACIDTFEMVDGIDSQKASWVTNAIVPLEEATNFIDEKGDRYEIYEYVEELMQHLYQLIGSRNE